MFCSSCGTALPTGARFCSACGHPVVAAPTPPPPVTPAASDTTAAVPLARGLSIVWAYTVDPQPGPQTGTADPAAGPVRSFVDAVKHNYALGVRRHAKALTSLPAGALLAGAANLEIKAPAEVVQAQLAVQAADPALDDATQRAVLSVGTATLTGADRPERARAALAEMVGDSRLSALQRGDVLLRVLLAAGYASRAAQGMTEVVSVLPAVTRVPDVEPPVVPPKPAGPFANDLSMPVGPSAWTTFVITLLFGVFGLIPALIHSMRARDDNRPTGPYWLSFCAGLVCCVAAYAAVGYLATRHS